MAITFIGASAGSGNTDATINPHASMATDDIWVIGGGATNSTTDINCTANFSGGGGSEAADLYANGTVDVNAAAFYKIQGGSLDTFCVLDAGSFQGYIGAVFRGIDLTTPSDTTATSNSGVNGGTPAAPAITTVTDGAMIVTFVIAPDGATITNPPDGGGYTFIQNTRNTALTGFTVAAAYKEKTTAGADSPGNWNDVNDLDAGDAWITITMALRPAGGGGSTYTLDADAGSYAITGTAAALERGYLIDADAGSYAITGQDAALQQGYQVVADAGAYAISGSDADFIYNRAIDADAGSYLINGADASLEYTPSGSTYNLDAEGGAYLITGSDAALDYVQLIHRILDADAGSYLISGSDALLEYSGAPSQSDRPTGGWDTPGRGNYDFLGPHRPQHLRQKREEEREELHITEQQQRKIDRAAVKIAREGLLTPPAIMAAPSFDALLSALQPTEGMIAALVSAIMERASWIQAQQLEAEEEAAIIRLLMEL